MCGIAGMLNFDGTPPSLTILAAMTESQRHRGPDGQSLFRQQGVGLGHRRLSIIDVAGGTQPLANESNDVWLTFNGEIYNYRELRDELTGCGHQFRSESDSEVIVHAYEQWGDGCVHHFRGMFAFAIVDFRRERLLLARDHFGIKPLYYRFGTNYVAFASELQALLAVEPTTPPLQLRALEYYLRYRYIPAPLTVYQSILKLPPAHIWSCSFAGRAEPPREYYRLVMQPDETVDDATLCEEFGEVLEESVRAHLVADVPFGTFLSGGVDSTLIAATMAKQLGAERVQAFSIGFDDAHYSELPYAQHAAAQLGITLHTQVVQPDVVQIFADLFAHYGEPFADTSAVPTWCVARLAREHVAMVLSGDGADEAFAGYSRYARWQDAARGGNLRGILRHPRQALQAGWLRIVGGAPSRLRRWEQDYVGVFPESARRALWHDDLQHLPTLPCSAFSKADHAAERLGDLEYAQAIDLQTYLPGDILTKIDVATMCHGLEARTPFTDRKVMEFAARLPRRWRRRDTEQGRTLKALPKQFLTRQFPREFVERRKQGFAIPEAAWLRPGSPVRSCFQDVVASRHAPLRQYLKGDQIDQMVRDFDTAGRQATGLWLLLILGLWLEQSAGAAVRRAA